MVPTSITRTMAFMVGPGLPVTLKRTLIAKTPITANLKRIYVVIGSNVSARHAIRAVRPTLGPRELVSRNTAGTNVRNHVFGCIAVAIS